MANRNSIQIINLHTWFKSYVELLNYLEENFNLRQLIVFFRFKLPYNWLQLQFLNGILVLSNEMNKI